MNRSLRQVSWAWAPGVLLATGTIISSAAGSLLVQYLIEGTTESWIRQLLLGLATLAGGVLVWWAAQLNSKRSQLAGWFLHCTAATARYQRHRFETEDRAYRQWASRRAPSPHVLPPLQVSVDQPGGVLRYLEAVERDLEVAFGMSPDITQQVHLLTTGTHEANFWLGWYLGSTFRRSRPLKALSLVCDQPAAPGTDSHMAITTVAGTSDAEPAFRVIELDVTRRRPAAQPHDPAAALPVVSLACDRNGSWANCTCEQTHQSVIIAVDPEAATSDPASAREAAPAPTGDPADARPTDPVVKSSRMTKGIEDIAPSVGADAVLWITCDGIDTSEVAYIAFLRAVIQSIHQQTGGSGHRYLAFTGPVMLATLLGVQLANQGRWSFLAYGSGRYTEVPNPRAFSPPQRQDSAPATIVLHNYTPHQLTFLHDGQAIELPSLGVARCAERLTVAGSWDQGGEFPRFQVGYGEVSGLPGPQEGVVYLVSQLVVLALPDRTDLAYPHGLRRDATGAITGFSSLAAPERH